MKLYNKLPAFLFALLLISCGGNEAPDEEETIIEESPVEIAEAIVGDWQLEEWKRSDKPVPLEDFNISYSADGVFTSNLFDSSMEKPFENGLKATLEGSNIYFDDTSLSYYVEDISDSLLVISTEMNNFPFEFTFKKTN